MGGLKTIDARDVERLVLARLAEATGPLAFSDLDPGDTTGGREVHVRRVLAALVAGGRVRAERGRVARTFARRGGGTCEAHYPATLYSLPGKGGGR